jgi:hypothetical protein
MRALSGGMLLIIQYDAKTPVGNLRLVVAEVALDLPVPIEARPPVQRRQQPAQDPFAGNQWASDASTRQPGHRPQPTVVVDA